MTDEELDKLDQDVPELALKALADAQERAMKSGCDIVLLENDQLVKITPAGKMVLKDMPPRVKTTVRFKQAKRP